MMKIADDIKLYEGSGYEGFGNYGLENSVSAESAGSLFSSFVSRAIGIITIIAFIWFLFILITGSVGIISSGGDKQAVEGAKKKITTGLIGLIVLISGVFVARFIGTFLGIENFMNPAMLIEQLTK